MKPNRWQQVEEVYHAVLERPADERPALLAARCADDPDLFREVEELLRYEAAAEDFIEENAMVVAAQQIGAEDLGAIDRKSLVGEKIGVYKILAPLGRGGMGEVYRAHDERLSRDVAIKIIPAEFSRDADRLRRFEREARATSALNHPNILTVYDIASHDGVPCIIAELLEGEELRVQLKHGQLSVRKAIEYGQQITSGLAAAHEKGITHRDLKPENLFVTKDGRIKILDFGLAKLKPLRLPDGVDSAAPTREPQTDPGTVMGTVGYMSPEQVRGLQADHRADIFSFGVILYEMLTGRQPFLRETATDTNLAAVGEEPEEVTAVNNKVPPELGLIVRRCLEKKPERRFYSAHDLGFALEALATSSNSRLETERESTAATVRPGNRQLMKRERWLWIAVTALAALTAFGLAWYFTRQPAAEARLMELYILPPERASFIHIAVSPDGRWLAFTAATGGKVQLWVRALGSSEAKTLAGTERATLPFWSPDSQFIGFFAGGKLKKIDVSGGRPATLCDAGIGTGGTWSREGAILFSSLGGTGISRVAATGGEVTSVLKPDWKGQESDYSDPWFLPDGRHFLYHKFGAKKETRGVYLASLDGGGGERVLGDDSNAVYAASGRGGGYLIFGHDGALMAQPFDADRRQVTGEPFSVAGQVGAGMVTTSGSRRRDVSVSDTGVLVFDPLPNRQRNQFIWVDRGGRETGSVEGLDNATIVRISPDDKRFMATRFDFQTGYSDLWLCDVASGKPTRFTFEQASDSYPLWSPDGSRIVWESNREGLHHLYQKAASGAGQDELLLKSDYFKFPSDWSRDGRFIIYRQIDPKTKYDVWVLPMGPLAGDQKPFPFLQTDANEAAAVLSPDGQWMAYSSDESGQYEVYVQSFPNGGGKRQISTGGGIGPYWRGDGKEMFYHSADGKMMAVAVKGGPGFEAGAPVALFEFRAGGNLITPYYSVTSDGQRFLLSTIVEIDTTSPLTVIVNWTADLKR